jgi:hypothetical protein
MACICGKNPCPQLPRIGQVVVTEGDRNSWISRAVAKATGSWITHCFIVTDTNEAVEAWFPKVHSFDLTERMQELRKGRRAYAVLDLMTLTAEQRSSLVATARSFRGRFYDVGQALLFAMFHRFFSDGPGTLVCSRLITATFKKALGVDLFDELTLRIKFHSDHPNRQENLLAGQVTPADLLRSRLKVIRWVPSSFIRTWKGV